MGLPHFCRKEEIFSMAGISFRDISFAYGDKVILDHFSLDVEDSQIMCLLGPSGCGKTTLMRCLLGLNKPSTGEIYVGDRCVFSRDKRINIPPERRGIGVVFQDYAVWPHMTVMENVCYPMKKQRLPKDEIDRKARYALEQVRMSEYAPYLPSQLSGGQQQRVAIARALVWMSLSLTLTQNSVRRCSLRFGRFRRTSAQRFSTSLTIRKRRYSFATRWLS